MAAPVAQIRLSPPECDAIRRAVERACHDVGARWSRIVLFGSRTDPSRRGGDIDLLVELAADSPADIYVLTQRLRLALEDELGPQRIDLVVDDGTAPTVFADLARSRGVELWSNR